jgi:hypothetical protein
MKNGDLPEKKTAFKKLKGGWRWEKKQHETDFGRSSDD